ncbi:MAG: hypothetical protein K1W34_13250 [Lachnospiraceae bacterium]
MKKEWCIEENFLRQERWSKGEECLNLYNVNLPPRSFNGNPKKWIEELTTFIYLYPLEWDKIYLEYQNIRDSKKIYGRGLEFFRDDEGYLRKEGEEDIYLKISIRDVDCDIWKRIEQLAERREILTFQEYMFYCGLDTLRRKRYMDELKNRLCDKIFKAIDRDISSQIQVSFEPDYDNSAFVYNDFYVDALNDSYIIL